MSMTSTSDRVEVITSVQRRRRWSASEKVRMVEETYEAGATVSLVARRHGVAPNQLFTWRRLAAQGALTTPVESPQSNGMAEAFVRTIKRDYARVSPRPDAETVVRQLPGWIAHYNDLWTPPAASRMSACRLWMQQSIRPVDGAIRLLAMMRIRFSSPYKVHGREGHVVVQAEERRSVPTCHHPPRICSARSAPIR